MDVILALDHIFCVCKVAMKGKKGVHPCNDVFVKGAPHTMDMVYKDDWSKSYSRTVAAFPAPWVKPDQKFWPTVGRIDNVYGDRNLVCTCPPVESFIEVA